MLVEAGVCGVLRTIEAGSGTFLRVITADSGQLSALSKTRIVIAALNSNAVGNFFTYFLVIMVGFSACITCKW